MYELQEIFLFVKNRKFSINFSDPKFRKLAMEYDFPEYILPTEFIVFLSYFPDLYQACLISTLWNTGARINEVISLTRKSFVLKQPFPYVRVKNHNDIAITKDFDKQVHFRQIPLTNNYYIAQLKTMIAQLNVLKKKYSIDTEKKQIWMVDEDNVISWFNQAIGRARSDGVVFPVNITIDAIRYSFILRGLAVGIEPLIVQKITGGSCVIDSKAYDLFESFRDEFISNT